VVLQNILCHSIYVNNNMVYILLCMPPIKANLPKGRGAKLQGLQLTTKPWLPVTEGVLFLSLRNNRCSNQQTNIRDILEGLVLSKSYVSLKEELMCDIFKLTEMLKSHDRPTYQHSLNVSSYSTRLANEFGLSEDGVTPITIAALLHDIGKTKIPSSILNKPGRLSHEEWELIKEHPREGVAFLAKYPWSYDMISMIGHHHEKVDGSGYYGLSGGEICLGAKIICIADAFDAMVSSRP